MDPTSEFIVGFVLGAILVSSFHMNHGTKKLLKEAIRLLHEIQSKQ